MYVKLMIWQWETQETYEHYDGGKGGKIIFLPQQTEISDRETNYNTLYHFI